MLDETGFQRQTYSELVDSIEDRAREQFGEDVNTSSKTPLGIIIRIFAWFLAGLWDIAERVYNSGFVSSLRACSSIVLAATRVSRGSQLRSQL